MTILVNGSADFIGANFVFDWLAASDEPIINLDKLTLETDLLVLAGAHRPVGHLFAGQQLVQRDLVGLQRGIKLQSTRAR